MIQRIFAGAVAGMLLTGSALATPTNDTTTAGPVTTGPVYVVGTGNSQYAAVHFNSSFTCGTNYGANGVRLSSGHPRYQDMLKSLLAAELSGGWTTIHYELISGQCWLKQIAVFMPGT